MSKNDKEELTKTPRVNSLELPLEALINGTIFLSGGRTLDGMPIITCSQKEDGTSPEELKEKEALDLLLHYSTLPKEEDKAKGYTVILNGPKLSQSTFTTVFQSVVKFQATLPKTSLVVIVVKTEEYDCTTSTGGVEIGDTSVCKVVYVEKVANVLEYVSEANLTVELGGVLPYDHQEWVKYRLRVEPFMNDCKSISSQLYSVIDDLHSELPLSAPEAEESLRLHQKKWTDIMNALHMTQLMNEGQRLIVRMEEESTTLKNNPEYVSSLGKVKSLLAQVTDLKTKIEMLWSIQCTRLTENFRFRKYEDEAQTTIGWFKDFAEEYLAANSGSGYTLDEVLCMRDDVVMLETHVKYALERCDILIKSAQEFQGMENYKQYWAQAEAVQKELEERSSSFQKDLAEWKDKVELTLQVHLIAHKVLNWCISISEILDTQDIGGQQDVSADEIDGFIQEVDTFSAAPEDVSPEELTQLEQSLDSCLSPYVRDSAVVAVNRSKEIQERMRQRKEGLQKMMESLTTESGEEKNEEIIEETKHVASALQGVLLSLSSGPHEGDTASKIATIPLSPNREENSIVLTVTPSHEVDRALEDLETAVQRIQDNEEWSITPESTGKAGKEGSLSSKALAEFTDSGKFRANQPMIELMQPEGLQLHAQSTSGDTAAQAKAEEMSKKRKLIVKELVETEEAYVRDLELIVNNYVAEYENGMSAINDPSMKTEEVRSLPGTLIGRGTVLFCNIEQLLLFTREVFLPELRTLTKSPMRLGTVFCQYEGDLMQYAPYFKNTPAQEALMQEAGAKFFAETQKRIGSPFPLGDYLIKPFQRVSRYNLFLQGMIKNTPKTIKGAVLENLRKAQKHVEFILRHGNDLLAVENLQGVEGGVKQLGKIRRQGDLVHVEGMISKKEKRIFLFEQAVVIAKKTKAPRGSLMNEVFQAKVLLRLNELSMREDLQDQPTRFELSDTKKNKYLFQCSARDNKEEWLSDLRDLFFEQMKTLKEQSQQNFIYMTSKDVQEPIYAYTARTTGKAASRAMSFRHPSSRVSGLSGPKRLSSDLPRLPSAPYPGRSDDGSIGSTPRSSKVSGGEGKTLSTGEHVYEELPAVRRTGPVPVVPPLPPRPTQEASEYDVIPPLPPRPEPEK